MLAVFGMFFMEEAYAQNSADHTSHNIIPVRLKVGALTEAEFPENIANVTKSISSELLFSLHIAKGHYRNLVTRFEQ